MKTRTKLLIVLGFAMAGTLALAACAGPDTTYKDYAGRGANVIITYDKNGGEFASNPNIDIKDVYYYSDLEGGLKLLAPGDPNRGQTYATSIVTRSGYQLAGWYTERTERTDAQGNALDDYGELVSVSNRPQGYTYSGRWDFSSKKLTETDLNKDTESWGTVYRLTLYAAWVPNFTYDFYAQDAQGKWQYYGSTTRTNGMDTPLPAWSKDSGALEYSGIPVYKTDTMTYSMTGIYLDEALAQPVADDNMDRVHDIASDTLDANGNEVKGIPHGGSIDLEHGIGLDLVRKCYTTWRERAWYRISTPAQFISNMIADAGFEIKEDLHFTTTDSTIPWIGSALTFKGIIEGGGHTIDGLTSTQAKNARQAGGLFTEIAAGAVIRNVKFTNMSFTVSGTTQQGGLYGLLAASIDDAATIEGVTVTGTIHVYDPVDTSDFGNYTIGLVSGDLNARGIATGGITAVADQVNTFIIGTGYVPQWPVLVAVGEDGRVTITPNPTPDKNPSAEESPSPDEDPPKENPGQPATPPGETDDTEN